MTTSNYITLDPKDLSCFNSIVNRYELPPLENFRYKFVYSDGVQYLISNYKLDWVIRDIAELLPPIVKRRPDRFYCAILTQIREARAHLMITDRQEKEKIFCIFYDQINFRFTGCDEKGKPIEEMKLFLVYEENEENEQEQGHFCLMVPSEY